MTLNMYMPHDEFLIALLLVQGVIFVGAVVLRRWAGYGWSLFVQIRPKSFPELAGFSPEDQDRLFEESCHQALRSWRWIPAAVPFLLLIAVPVGIAKSVVAGKNLAGAELLWVACPIAGLGAILFALSAKRLSVWGVRPFLRKMIEGRTNTMQA